MQQDSHPSLYITLKHCIICIFLIRSGSLQKMLKALFKLVWNAQRTTWKIFVSTECKIFLNIEKVFVEISEEQLMHYTYLFSSHF